MSILHFHHIGQGSLFQNSCKGFSSNHVLKCGSCYLYVFYPCIFRFSKWLQWEIMSNYYEKLKRNEHSVQKILHFHIVTLCSVCTIDCHFDKNLKTRGWLRLLKDWVAKFFKNGLKQLRIIQLLLVGRQR